jgi:hypothetical protein
MPLVLTSDIAVFNLPIASATQRWFLPIFPGAPMENLDDQ